MKKWIFSTFILMMAIGTHELRADDAQERAQFQQLAATLKSFKELKPGLEVLKEANKIASSDLDLEMDLETVKRFAIYVEELPPTERLDLLEGALNQLDLTIRRIEKRNSGDNGWKSKKKMADVAHYEREGSYGNRAGLISMLTLYLFRGGFHTRNIVTSGAVAILASIYAHYLPNPDADRATLEILANENSISEIKSFIEEKREELITLREMNAVTVPPPAK